MISKIKGFLSLDKLKANKKLLIYLFFVCMSTVFWFLNTLNKEYTTNIVFPVKYTDLPQGKILLNKLPSHLNLTVKSYGFELMRYKLMSFMPITLRVNSLIGSKDLLHYSLSTSKIKNKISRKLGTPLSLLDIKPDSIHFHFSSVVSRKFPIKINLKYELEQQYMLKNKIILVPDSVMVHGAKYILDSLRCIETNYVNLDLLNKSIVKSLKIRTIDNVDISLKQVKLHIEIEKYTESSKLVPLKAINVPDSIILRLFPAQIKISYFVGLSKYKLVSLNDFDAVIDYNIIKNGISTLKVSLNIDNYDVSNINVSPKNVSFLIEKKNK